MASGTFCIACGRNPFQDVANYERATNIFFVNTTCGRGCMYCIRCSEQGGEEKRCPGCDGVFDITKLCDVSVAMRNYNGLCGSDNPKTVYNEDKESFDFDGITIEDVEAGRSRGENQVEYFKGSVAIVDSKDGACTRTVVRSGNIKGTHFRVHNGNDLEPAILYTTKKEAMVAAVANALAFLDYGKYAERFLVGGRTTGVYEGRIPVIVPRESDIWDRSMSDSGGDSSSDGGESMSD